MWHPRSFRQRRIASGDSRNRATSGIISAERDGDDDLKQPDDTPTARRLTGLIPSSEKGTLE